MMKALLALIFCVSGVIAAPQQPSRDQIVLWLEQLQQIHADESQALGDSKVENLRLKAAVSAGSEAIVVAQQKAAKAEKEFEDLRQWGIGQQERADAETIRATKAEKESNRRGNFIGWLGGALALFVAWKFVGGFTMAPIVQYSILAGAAGAGYMAARLLI